MAPVSENPKLGSTEVWKIVNTTGDTHPMHLHLTQFQLVSRQAFDTAAYQTQFDATNGTMGFDGMMPNDSGNMAYQEVDPTPYLLGPAAPAEPNERGWKDTVRMNPGEVTTIVVRFAPADGSAAFPFDATAEPGYEWHCHIVDHEDNEMMRPYKLQP
jgi:FtsP/CotA-like multicopper oxidase with cupredoxin domain